MTKALLEIMSDRPTPYETIPSSQEKLTALNSLSAESPCPYLPGVPSRFEAYRVDGLDGETYERLLARGFRRSGRMVYRPRCKTCRECKQIRVLVERFVPTSSMRRVLRRNADVRVDTGEARASEEKFKLYQQYLSARHDDTMSQTYESFVMFLTDSPTTTQEFCYRLGERLIGVSVVDRCPGGLSSVFMYFDPGHARRSLGTLSVLREIAYCGDMGLPYYYLGYYVADSRTMAYKARFRPNEILMGNEHWGAFQE